MSGAARQGQAESDAGVASVPQLPRWQAHRRPAGPSALSLLLRVPTVCETLCQVRGWGHKHTCSVQKRCQDSSFCELGE